MNITVSEAILTIPSAIFGVDVLNTMNSNTWEMLAVVMITAYFVNKDLKNVNREFEKDK
ncbi:hypothetical protein ACPV5V_19345 [Vibrio campbellii]